MGSTHALTGAVGYLALVPALPGSYPATAVAVGVVTAGAAATMPDLDHPRSTVARVYGPLTRWLARAVSDEAGGHRAGTHSLLAVGLAALGTWGAVQVGGWVLAALLVLVLGTAAAVLGYRLPGPTAVLVPVGLVLALSTATGAVLTSELPLGVLPLAIACGWLAHLLGDAVTRSGVPFLWPLARRRVVLGRLRTGGVVENGVVVPAMTVLLVLLVVLRLDADLPGAVLDGLYELVAALPRSPATTG